MRKLLSTTFVGVTVTIMALSLGSPASGQMLTPEEMLGKELFFDKISEPQSQSCAGCHGPSVGFTGPIPGVNRHGSVYHGAVPQRFGNRKPPSAAYATLSPVFHFDAGEGLFVGGNFWDGRATGHLLGNPAADQALGPFLNPVEQNNPSMEAVCRHLAGAKYAGLYHDAYGEPASCSSPEEVSETYHRIGLSIAAYEASHEVNQFSSKYDYYLAGMADLTATETWGMELFNGKAMCALCHPGEPGPAEEPPLFTDFTYDNLGVPRNPENPFYDMDAVFLPGGDVINPEGMAWVDQGLGGFLESIPEWAAHAAENYGKQKVPTLRNVAKAPGRNFPKAYAHNGYFKSLKGIVHFYNTRDVKPGCSDPFTTEADALSQGCWPMPEVTVNVNGDELGDLGLTEDEEWAVVEFMRTLSDGYRP